MTSIKKNDYAIFTVCNLAYLPKALILAESIEKFNNVKLKIYLFDRKKDIDFSSLSAELYWIEDLQIPYFNQLAFKYDIVEFSTCLKPYLTLRLMENYGKVIFFDPDICTYHSVIPIINDLEYNPILLTPHYTTPISNHKKQGWNNDLGMMRFGSFNLGFYGVKDDQQGMAFLNWWSDRCMDLCYMESQFGLSTDQKWVSIAPCFFPDLKVSFHSGYNAAPWNIFERNITKNANGNYVVNITEPLIFFHFSNFDKSDIGYLNELSNYGENLRCPALMELCEDYCKSQTEKEKEIVKTEYSFDYMSGGEYISPTFRRAYASILSELPEFHDPFDSEGVVAKFAEKNRLFEVKTKVESKKSIGFKNLESNRGIINVIYFMMRIILRIYGPNKFNDLSRLMVYLSSYRQNRGLWKL